MISTVNLVAILAWTFIWIIIGKFVFDKIYYKKISLEMELLSKNNMALAISFSGFILGFSIALIHSIDPIYPIYINGITGTLMIVLILLFTRIFDWIFLQKIDLPTEIIDHNNHASGLVEGSFFLSMGLVISGAFSGYDVITSWSYMYFESILYCLLGIILLFISSIILSFILKVNMQEELLKNNSAVAISFSGIFIATAMVIKDAISGPTQDKILYDILITSLDWIVALAIMVILFFLFDLVLFRKFSFKEELKEPNIGAGIIIGVIFVSSALISSLLIP